jgi:hypothetical protein
MRTQPIGEPIHGVFLKLQELVIVEQMAPMNRAGEIYRAPGDKVDSEPAPDPFRDALERFHIQSTP